MSRIVIFDSGVGGLSIYQEVVKKCPNHDYIFVSDNLAFPYGTKPETELIDRVISVVKALEMQYKPDVLVVACNTASTVALPHLRSLFNFPIVGVVPAIKPAAKLSKSNVIGLLATPGTIERDYTNSLINEFAKDCTVIKVGSSRLVEIAEHKMCGNKPSIDEIKHELMPFFSYERLDCLVLACTHFPLLNNEISIVFKEKNNALKLIDSGLAIASRVSELCPNPIKKSCEDRVAVFTKTLTSEPLTSYLKSFGFNQVDMLT